MKLPLTPEQMTWMAAMKTPVETNPCRRSHGHGPAGKRCKDCALLIRKHYAKTYFKCGLRGDTNGPGTDHKARWLACGKFQTKPEAT